MDMFGPMPFAASDSISKDPTDPMPGDGHHRVVRGAATTSAIDIVLTATYPEPGRSPRCVFAGDPARGRGRSGAMPPTPRTTCGRSGEFLLELVGVPPFPEAAPPAARRTCGTPAPRWRRT